MIGRIVTHPLRTDLFYLVEEEYSQQTKHYRDFGCCMLDRRVNQLYFRTLRQYGPKFYQDDVEMILLSKEKSEPIRFEIELMKATEGCS